MAKKYCDIETLKFILDEVNDFASLFKFDFFSDHDAESMDTFFDSVKDFSDQELYPCFADMDKRAARFENGTVETPKEVATVFQKGGEMGLISGTFSYESGGLQMPLTCFTAAHYIMDAANNHLPGYLGLTMGAAELIDHFASEELKATYVEKMGAGEWGGTMCLTEPQAGSSLSDIVTAATPTEEDYYKIKGQKIFISGGDHKHCDNIVHLLLARIDGAPAGTKGISLFVVPKLRPENDGSLTPNDVLTAGDFQKLGQKGYCTTHLMFGENDECRGYLVGAPHKGLKYMFLMMNGARIAVGRGGAAIVSAAYEASLQYAQERTQGRKITNTGKKDVNEGQTLIINHADVRRMLLMQKSVAEGSLNLVLKAAKMADMAAQSPDEKVRERCRLLLEILIPVVKTYPSEMGAQSVSNGLQILGGYGFCEEYILQQYYRDIRIFSLYEGTTGIQSLDLLGRKVVMNEGQALKLLAGEVMQTITAASQYDELKPYGVKLGEKLQLIQKVLTKLGGFAKQGNFERYTADATIFMEMFGHVVMSWLWLEMATVAKEALVKGDTAHSAEFYESKIHTMKYYFKYELAKTTSQAEVLMDEASLTIAAEKEIFV